ncbi:MAG TPA: hypothetical protein VG015_08325, partial [Candidatus Dormibacteraeota bacterium]|nr:hypothetical protein [Candidatus Dormibacteraeota bacterium]
MNLGDFGPPPPPSLPTDSWRRIHPLSPVIRASRALIPIALILGSSLIGSSGRGGLGGTLGHLVLALVLVGLGLISWL